MTAILDLVARNTNADGIPNRPLTEEESKAFFLPGLHTNLNCLYAMLVGISFLYGVYLVLLMRYTSTYRKTDNWWIKGLVLATATLITTHAFFNWYFLHYLLVKFYGQYKQFFESDKYGYDPVLDAIISGCCQSFFAHRAFRLNNRNWFILGPLMFLIFVSVSGGIGVWVVFFYIPNELWAYKFFPPEMLWLVGAMTADLMITISILVGLYKSRTGWRNTDHVISRLIRMTLEAQVPVLLGTVIYMVIAIENAANLLAAIWMGVLPYIYGIGFLYSLNSRMRWSKGQNITMDNGGETFQNTHRQAATIQVEVQTETYESRTNRPQYSLNRAAGDDKLDDIKSGSEWDDEEKTQTFGSVNSGQYNAKLESASTPSRTPSGAAMV